MTTRPAPGTGYRAAFLLAIAGAVALAAAGLVAVERPSQKELERLEASGVEPRIASPRADLRAARAPRRSPDGAPTGLLLVPDSTNKRVIALDPATGNVVNLDLIPADATHLATPICAILNAAGNKILVSDQINDVVQAYNLDGSYSGVFAPAGGVNTAILDNVRGIALRPNGNLLVTVGGSGNVNSVAEFDGTTGAYLGQFVAAGAGGLSSPFDAFFRGADLLVGGSSSGAIHRYDASTGAYVANFATAINFPEQIALASNGNVLVANFSTTPLGVVEMTSAGAFVANYSVVQGLRGVYELPSGNILTTSGNGIFEITRANTLVRTIVGGVSARFIEYAPGLVPVELTRFTAE